MFLRARTETLEPRGAGCQGLWPAAADEILSGSTDLCGITESLTEVLLDRDEDGMSFLGEICSYTHTHMHGTHGHPPVSPCPATCLSFGCVALHFKSSP